MVLAVDYLNPSPVAEARKHKLKTLVPTPRSFFMDVKCPGCFTITTVFSHAQTVVICQGCTTVLCQPTGDEALEYLKSVRTDLLIWAGPPVSSDGELGGDMDRSINTNGIGNAPGYYEDGAYIAAPDPVKREEHDDSVADNHEQLLHQRYFNSLINKFHNLRTQLRQEPSFEAIAALPLDHETRVGRFGSSKPTFLMWTDRIRRTDPLPVQVAAMNRQSVVRLIRVILGSKFLRRGCELRERTSRWIWALLARLPDQGELDYVDAGWVRALGKRAVLMMVSIADMTALQEEVDGGLGGEDASEDEEEYREDSVKLEQHAGLTPPLEATGNPVEKTQDEATDILIDNQKPLTDQHMSPLTAGDDVDGEMDMDLEDGEVPDDPPEASVAEADLAAAKARLLAQVSEVPSWGKCDVQASAGGDLVVDESEPFDEIRARVNMRATLNMVLTVAGEFYGQRDLLEFRNPFTTM
ncbi:hypothetical protein P8C59_009436 [Phyllachora maydis]|uniref:40S ribosomal protein S27 n=1 Tax=Phyllachora maydis TaxID=1825666 RepID=A0AAD9IF29_9PEZI|nr:hypothetical protein P8C59_009436 [Phyllachora maydis]